VALAFKKLTRPNIRKTVAGEKLVEHGICFERLANGDGTYSVNVMVDGQRVHRVIGRESERTTRTQAEQFISTLRHNIKHKRLGLPKGRKLVLSFKEAAKEYIKRLEATDGKDIHAKSKRLELHLTPFFGDKPLDGITTLEVDKYKAIRLKERPVKSRVKGKEPTYKDTQTSPATVNRELAVLSHLVNQAIEWKWINQKPAIIRRLEEDNKRIIYLTIEQASRLVECAKADQNLQVYPFMEIGLGTSMRLSEILRIKKEHVDIADRKIWIPKAKAGGRDQPITSKLAKILEKYIGGLQQGCSWLFPSPSSKTGHTVNINKAFRRVVEAAELDPSKIVRHTLRHTAITHLVQAGVDLPTVQRISGHKTLSMVARYAHANGEHIGAAMDKLEDRMGSVI
jgi:integrase